MGSIILQTWLRNQEGYIKKDLVSETEEVALCKQLPITHVVEAYSILELEEHLRETPKPGTPPVPSPDPDRPLTPGAARITTEAVNRSAEDIEAYVDQLQVIVERLLPGW